jgi:putative phage-type endonuclease
MPITDAQRELRKSHLGSSDMAAILGFDKFKTAYDVWLEKTDRVEPQAESAAMEAGTMFEDGVLAWAEKQLGPIIRNQYRRAEGLPIGSNIDALLKETGEPIEAKTAGLFGPVHDVWGEDGSDQVPDRVIIQCHVHMLCCNSSVCHCAAFIGGRGFVLFHIKLDPDIAIAITDASRNFWTNHVLANVPPENALPSPQLCKRMKREPNKTVDIEPYLVKTWLEAKDLASQAKEKAEQAQTAVMAAMCDAECGNCDGLGMLTYFPITRKGYIVKDTTYRTLKYKELK